MPSAWQVLLKSLERYAEPLSVRSRLILTPMGGVVSHDGLAGSSTAESLRSSACICTKPAREWSSMATWANSQPAPSTESRRSPVTRWLGPHDAAELLGVDVQHLAGRHVLVAHDRAHRLECLQAGQAQPRQHPADGGDAAADELGDLAHRHAQPAQLLDRALQHLIQAAARAARPRAAIGQRLNALLLRSRLSHLRAVRRLTPAASAAAASPMTAIRSSNNLRPSRVNLAFLCTFTRSSSL